MKITNFLFFDFSSLKKLSKKYPELFLHYNYWLYRSTISIEAKKQFIRNSNTEKQISEAISVLQNNYCVSKINLRNLELESHLKQRMDSS